MKSARAFTLIEILVATTLLGLVVAGSLGFFLSTLNTYHYEVGKILVNRDIRSLTSEMSDNATYANYFLVYASFNERTRLENIIDPYTGQITEVEVDAYLGDGGSGDMMVLVYMDPNSPKKIAKLIGYYRDPGNADDPTSQGPVRRFVVKFNPSSNATPVDLLPNSDTIQVHPEVVELSEGLADGKLFYNFRDRSVMVKGKIIHRGSLVKRATNTYNFTISPRG